MMKIINRSVLHTFIKKNPGAAEWLKTWILKVSHESWGSLNDIVASFPKAEIKDQESVYFVNAKDHYCLAVAVHCPAQIVAIKEIVLT